MNIFRVLLKAPLPRPVILNQKLYEEPNVGMSTNKLARFIAQPLYGVLPSASIMHAFVCLFVLLNWLKVSVINNTIFQLQPYELIWMLQMRRKFNVANDNTAFNRRS